MLYAVGLFMYLFDEQFCLSKRTCFVMDRTGMIPFFLLSICYIVNIFFNAIAFIDLKVLEKYV